MVLTDRKGIGGKKGRSGRKPLHKELEMHKLIELSYFTLIRALNSKVVPESKKIDIALAITCKAMPSKLEHSAPKMIPEEERIDRTSRIQNYFVIPI